MAKAYATLQEAFDARVRVTANGCLLWTGNIARHGYGTLCFQYEDMYAHRIAWRLHYGAWPTLHVCHHCDNRACVKWEHLFEGDDKANVQDAARKNRMGRPNTIPQHIREEIRAKLALRIPQRTVAREYGISQGTVSEINRGLHENAGREQDYTQIMRKRSFIP